MLTRIIRPTPLTVRLRQFLTHFAESHGGAELYVVRVIVEQAGPGHHTPASSHEVIATLLTTEQLCGPDTWRETDVTIDAETYRVTTDDTRRTWDTFPEPSDPNLLAVFLREWAHLKYVAALQGYTRQLTHQTVPV